MCQGNEMSRRLKGGGESAEWREVLMRAIVRERCVRSPLVDY